MKPIQGVYFQGYVKLTVKGNNPELFFQKCIDHRIVVWNVKKTADDVCEGYVKVSDIRAIRKLNRQTKNKIYFTEKKGYPFLFHRFHRQRPLWIGLILAILLFFVLSNIVWNVEVTGVPKEIEAKIEKQLRVYGVHPGAWIFGLESPNTIQQRLISDIPELLWVGVEQKGTTYHLEGIEKIVVKEAEAHKPRNLIASKKGVIKKLYVEKGVPMVKVNDYVEPGDILVSGEIESAGEENKDKKDKNKKEKVAAEGEIYATTWYEVNVTVPLKYKYEKVTGNKETKYFLQIGEVEIPIWGFGKPSFQKTDTEIHEQAVHFFGWKLPIQWNKRTYYEKEIFQGVRTEAEAKEIGKKQAKADLLLQLGPDAKILSENVLQERLDDGKVKLNLYITVEENIVRIQPLNQGD